MRVVGRVMAIVVLALASSSCAVVRVEGPDENRPERFDFVAVPAGRQEAVAAFRSMVGPGPERIDETTVVPLGKIDTSAGPVVFAEFQMIDANGQRSQCSGSAGPSSGGWGCGPIGQAPSSEPPGKTVMLSSSGSTGTWSEVELRVGGDVAFLEAVADDGTRYRMEPIAGTAWMEWKTERGELRITAFDRDGEPVASVETG